MAGRHILVPQFLLLASWMSECVQCTYVTQVVSHPTFHLGSRDGAGRTADWPGAETRRGKSGIRRRAAGQNALGRKHHRSERQLEDEIWERHCEMVEEGMVQRLKG